MFPSQIANNESATHSCGSATIKPARAIFKPSFILHIASNKRHLREIGNTEDLGTANPHPSELFPENNFMLFPILRRYSPSEYPRGAIRRIGGYSAMHTPAGVDLFETDGLGPPADWNSATQSFREINPHRFGSAGTTPASLLADLPTDGSTWRCISP
jgi:hypothetical protein